MVVRYKEQPADVSICIAHASGNCTVLLTLFVNGCIYRRVDAWKVLTDVLWVTEIHNSSVFVVAEEKSDVNSV